MEECFGANSIVVQGERGFASVGVLHQVLIHVPLAETGKGRVLIGGPAGKPAKLNLIITLVFLRAGGPEVEGEHVECLRPGEGRGSG